MAGPWIAVALASCQRSSPPPAVTDPSPSATVATAASGSATAGSHFPPEPPTLPNHPCGGRRRLVADISEREVIVPVLPEVVEVGSDSVKGSGSIWC
jgi:hypothetical protein